MIKYSSYAKTPKTLPFVTITGSATEFSEHLKLAFVITYSIKRLTGYVEFVNTTEELAWSIFMN